jgi:hypothetical protein
MYGSARLSLIHLGLIGGLISSAAWPVAVVVTVSVLQAVGVTLLVAFAHGAAARAPLRPWLLTTATAALLAATGIRVSMGAVQPMPYSMLVLFVDYAILLAIYGRYDLLTLAATIGTFALWWVNYPLFVMQRPIGAAQAWIAFTAWGLGVAAAAALAFQEELRSGYQRAAAAFN